MLLIFYLSAEGVIVLLIFYLSAEGVVVLLIFYLSAEGCGGCDGLSVGAGGPAAGGGDG